MKRSFAVFIIGEAAGQGVATPANILVRVFARRGLHLYAYSAHQSTIRGTRAVPRRRTDG